MSVLRWLERRFAIQRKTVAVLAILLAAPFVAFPPLFIPHALLDGGDDLVANIPELVYSGKQLLSGEIFWTRRLWMGHPLLAEPEFATFYLPKLLVLVGAPMVAYAAYLVLHYIAAEIGAYLYLKSLGIGRLGAVFGALAYAYSGFMLAHRAHTMYVCAGAWTPFVLLLFDRAAERGGRVRHLVAALAFAMVPFSGAVQLAVYLAGLVVLLAGARTRFERSRRPVLGALACLVPGLLVSAAQLVPSFDFARQLATGMRADYALDVAHSFHPLLLPTLAFSIPPLDAEVYTRAGAVVVCAVAVALARIHGAPSKVRAWAIVAGVALVMMFGRYVAPVAHLLHSLPFVGVLRGPARHNFEFGLALSVLGAYGVDRARRVGGIKPAYFVVGAMLWCGAAYGAFKASEMGLVSDSAASEILEGFRPTVAVGALLAVVPWFTALVFRNAPWSTALWSAVALTPVLEAAWAMRVEAYPNRSALGQIETARAALPEPRGTMRILSVSLHRGSVDDLVGNSVLLHPGVESLQGYSSIVYENARALLDLDMHGQPNEYDELAFSVLPSIFGVTHVVLPSITCADARFSLARPDDRCERTNALVFPGPEVAATSLSATSAPLTCAVHSTDSWNYELEAGVRAERSDDERGATFSFLRPPRWDRRIALEFPGSTLVPEETRRAVPLRVADVESWGALMVENSRSSPIEFVDAGLFVQREVTVALLGPPLHGEMHGERAETVPNALRLSPEGGEAKVERRVLWPAEARRGAGHAVLEVEARATSGDATDLVVDLYRDAGYDPDAAQIVVRGQELGREFRVFRKEVSLEGAPDEFLLRAFTLSGGPVEVREARLGVRFEDRVYGFPTAPPHVHGVHFGQGRIMLGANARISGGMHLPVRPLEVVLDADAPGASGGAVRFGLEADTRYEPARVWSVDAAAFDRGARIHHVTVLPPDLADATLFVRAEGGTSLRVHELTATDACALRGYANPRRLTNGLFLYENPKAVPRAYAVGNTVRADGSRAIRRALLDLHPSDLGRTAVVGFDLPQDLRPGTVELAAFGERSSEMVVTAEGGPTLLVDNERFDPDWQATVDGGPARVFLVNGWVRGVVVPDGTHRVRFFYRVPAAVWIGFAIAALGVLVALVVSPALQRSRDVGR